MKADILDIIEKSIANGLSHSFDDIVTEGLRRKGYAFPDESRIYDFIKEYCKIEEHIHLQQRIFYVNNQPFLLHNYKPEEMIVKEIEGNITMSAHYGTYAFL